MMSSRLGLTAEVMATESPSQESPVVIQITWASTASVAFWFGTNSAVTAIAHLSCCRLLLSFSRSSEVGRPPAGPSRAGRRRPSARAPCRGARRRPRRPRSRPRSRAPRSASSAASAASGATIATITPSLATYIGSMPRSSAAPATSGDTGTSASRTRTDAVEARASSFSTDATPPRVASRMQRSDGPAALHQRVGGRPKRARVGLDLGVEPQLAAGEHDRGAVRADRAGHEHAVAGLERGGGERCPLVALADARRA